MITWRRLREEDFPLLSRWLAQPHVARWWNHETSLDAVERDFGPSARGEEPNEDWLAILDGKPLGLVQRSRLIDYPEDLAEFAAIVTVPDNALTIDYLIGEPDQVGRGLGSRMIREMVGRSRLDHPEAEAVLVAVVAANRASWRALEKAGANRVGAGDMAPDNPIDEPLHFIYRFDCPPTRPVDDRRDETRPA
jgi:aminoglycoside 6'-N-acetyltransferase